MLNNFPTNTTRAKAELLKMLPEILERLENGQTVELRLSRRGLLKASSYYFQRLQVRSEEEQEVEVNNG